jgi:hypothetical protein
VRPLADSEVLTWWARLDAFNGDMAIRAEKHLADAQRANAQDADVWFWLGRQAALKGFIAGDAGRALKLEHTAIARAGEPV